MERTKSTIYKTIKSEVTFIGITMHSKTISRLPQKDFQRSLGLRTCFTIITKCHSRIQVVLNSKKQNGWETEIRTTLPTFENGKVFKVDVKCLDGEFEIYHNNKVSTYLNKKCILSSRRTIKMKREKVV